MNNPKPRFHGKKTFSPQALLLGGREGCRQLLVKPIFWIPLLCALALGYGYAAAHVAPGVDDLTMGYYVADGYYIQVGRLGGYLVYRLALLFADPLSAAEWIALPLMGVAGALWSGMVWRASEGRLGDGFYTAFGCLFVTFPLINEIWCFSAMNIMVAGGYVLIALALHALMGRGRPVLRFWAAALLIMAAVSMYESAAATWITGVCMALLLRGLFGAPEESKASSILARAALCAGALCAALLLETLLTRGVLFVMDAPEIVYTSRQLAWGKGNGVMAQLLVVLKEIVLKLFVVGAWYLPVGEYAAAIAVFVVLSGIWVKRRGPGLLLPLLGLVFSTVALALLQGYTVEYRACQSMALFVAFTAVMGAYGLSLHGRRGRSRAVLCAGLGVLTLLQGLNLDRWMRLDQRRFEEERGVVAAVCDTLGESFQGEKPVVFVGKYPLSQELLSRCSVNREDPLFNAISRRINPPPQSRKYVETNVQPWLAWAVDAFEKDGGRLNQEMGHILAYLGYGDIELGSDREYRLGKAAAADMPAYPEEGYIRDMGEYIAVKLGPTEPEQ